MNKQLDALLCDKNRKNIVKGLLFSAVLMLIVCVLVPGAAVRASAADPVAYLDANGDSQSCLSYTTVTSGTTSWGYGWYVVNANTVIEDRITVTGEANLILVNGATLKAEQGITVQGRRSLTIYAQSTDENTMGAV